MRFSTLSLLFALTAAVSPALAQDAFTAASGGNAGDAFGSGGRSAVQTASQSAVQTNRGRSLGYDEDLVRRGFEAGLIYARRLTPQSLEMIGTGTGFGRYEARRLTPQSLEMIGTGSGFGRYQARHLTPESQAAGLGRV